MTMTAHYVADDFKGGIWGPRDGSLGAYVLPTLSPTLTLFPRSRTRFRNILYMPDSFDALANLAGPNLAPQIGTATTFECVCFLTGGVSGLGFNVNAPSVSDGISYNIGSGFIGIALLAGGHLINPNNSSPWADVNAWHYLTIVIDLTVPGAQTFKVYDSNTLVLNQTLHDATTAANLATWSFLTGNANVEMQASGAGANAQGVIEWAIHNRAMTQDEVTFRTTYFRVLNQ